MAHRARRAVAGGVIIGITHWVDKQPVGVGKYEDVIWAITVLLLLPLRTDLTLMWQEEGLIFFSKKIRVV